ncbi:MAG: M42 family peptidase [Anaerolineae bacterium]
MTGTQHIDMDLLGRLSEAFGPAGDERAVREILRGALRERVDELRTDTMGNLFAVKRATSSAGDGRPLRVLLTAHMDEPSLMVVLIENNGLLRVHGVGRVESRALLGQAVRVGAGLPGVIGVTPVHLTSPDAQKTIPDIDSLSIDIGVDSREAAEGLVKRGDYAVFDTAFGTVGGLIKGKALDGRAGVAVLAAVVAGDYPCDVHAVFTVQEGVRARGARIAAYAVEPDAAFIIDGHSVDELPLDSGDEPPVRLGLGPVITLSENGFLANPDLVARLGAAADKASTPVQRAARGAQTGEGRAIHAARMGVPSAAVGLPVRYSHTAAALMHPADLDGAVALLAQTLRDMDAQR